MCPVDLNDVIILDEISEGIELTIEGADLSTGPENLAYQAAVKIQEKIGVAKGVRIHIEKVIPMGGGLAGGSSNAASLLKGCNELWDAGLTHDELHGLAAEMGSDVNLFLEQGACLCRGRGEMVEPVEWTEDVDIVLLNPGFGISTPETFKTYAALPELNKPGTEGGWQSSYHSPGKGEATFRLRNDLESAVFAKHFWMEEAKAWLRKQDESLDALMSGSGATLFALTSGEDASISLERKMKKYFGAEVMVARVKPQFVSHA